jgi:DNA-binding LacI/PurR family transcriptional regulator
LGYARACEKHQAELVNLEVETLPEVTSALVEATFSAVIIAVHTISIPELMRTIWQQGYQIPEDLSIVCLQADEIAKNLVRPMTSVSFDVRSAASQAAKMLIDELEGRSLDIEQLVLPPQLIVRESTMLHT